MKFLKKRIAKKNLRRVIETLPQDLVYGEYAQKQDDGTFCYCAVGYLMKNAGISDETLVSFESRGVRGIDQKAVEAVVDMFNLSVDDLCHIQVANDRWEDSTRHARVKTALEQCTR